MKHYLLSASLMGLVACAESPAPASQNQALVESAYQAVASGDMERFTGMMAPDIVWNEAESHPYADLNPYIGPEAIMSGLFTRLASDWDDFSATPNEFVTEGDRVVVFGRYKEVYKATGKALDIPFVHSWTVEDGKLAEFQQYTDTAALVDAMSAPSTAGDPSGGATDDPATLPTWTLADVTLFPPDRSLTHAEDGVALADGTLLVGDWNHGLMALSPDGTSRPFGDFAAAGFTARPATGWNSPNGISLEPDGRHVLIADITEGFIYRVDTQSETVTRILDHPFGVNSTVRDPAGAVWFTQSTQNPGGEGSEQRMFAAAERPLGDGAVYRIAPEQVGQPDPVVESRIEGLDFANGVAFDARRGRLYVAELMANRILSFDVDLPTGTLSNRRVLAEVTTPDNLELDEAGNLWVASPIANEVLVVDPDTGQARSVFQPAPEASAASAAEWGRRLASGESTLDMLGPPLWEPMPGLLTGIILTPGDGPVYVSGLGDALVRLERP